MLTAIEKAEDGSVTAVRFIAENPEESQHLASLYPGFLELVASKIQEPAIQEPAKE